MKTKECLFVQEIVSLILATCTFCLTVLHVDMFLFKHQDNLFLVINSFILITFMLLKQ